MKKDCKQECATSRSDKIRQGYKLEAAVAEIFENHGFRVIRNPGIAKPRQTDLYATNDISSLLIEVKGVGRKIDVGDIDALMSRLDRAPSDVVGALFTLTDLTKNAVREIESTRSRELLVFCRADFAAVVDGKANLNELIDRKRDALRTQRKVWLYKPFRAAFDKAQLPTAGEQFVSRDQRIPYIVSRAERPRFLFVRDVPSMAFGGSDYGFVLNLSLNTITIDDLAAVLALLHDRFGLSERGSFAIEQSELSWFGIGAQEFIAAASDWRERYRGNPQSYIHHSEELRFFDSIRDGWLLLSSQQRVDIKGRVDTFLHQSELSIGLPGIPVDLSAFSLLCRYTNNLDARFLPTVVQGTAIYHLKEAVPLKVVGELVRARTRLGTTILVTGIIVQNPFFGANSLPEELLGDERSAISELVKMDVLVCALKDWHDHGDVVDDYLLLGFEVGWANGTRVVRPFGTWNEIRQRANPRNTLDLRSEMSVFLREESERESIRTLLKEPKKRETRKNR